MVRKEVVAARLEKLREYLQILRSIQKFDLQRFKSDAFIHGTAERYLHLSIKCLSNLEAKKLFLLGSDFSGSGIPHLI
jgi:uncharacterized protein YutE (UPF0331/DUF86 family)